jgi:hypothetical protein
MYLTVGEILERIDAMRLIVREIESGGSVEEERLDNIALYLDEYIAILSNTKVKI